MSSTWSRRSVVLNANQSLLSPPSCKTARIRYAGTPESGLWAPTRHDIPVAVKKPKLSYHSSRTILSTRYPFMVAQIK